MNELYFEGWGYLKTNETNKEKAMDKLMKILSHEGFDFVFDKVELRNEDGEEIIEEEYRRKINECFTIFRDLSRCYRICR